MRQGRRILVLNERDPRHPGAGGAEVHCFEVFRRLAASGDDVTVLAAGFPGATAEEHIDGIRVLRLGGRLSYYAHVIPAYRRLRRERPFDAVAEAMCKFPYFSRLWVDAPIMVFVHHLFGLLAFRQVSAPIAAATYAAELLVPWLYRGLPVAAISPSTRDELVRKGFPASDVRVIPNAVDHARYRPGATRAPVPTVLSVGRLEPTKRMEVVIGAVASLPDVRLVIVGTGGEEGRLRARAAALGVADRVTFTGFVPDDEKIRLMQDAHVLATASQKEGWGLTVLEAAACGTPAVASDVPGLRDSVRDGETGLLVASGDAAAFAKGLRRLLDDAALRERMGRAAFDHASWFDWDATADAVSTLLDEVRAA